MNSINYPYSLGLLEDNPIVIERINSSLKGQKEIDFLFSATCIGELEEQLKIHQPKVLIIDVILKDVDGLELFRDLNKKYPESIIFAFTNVSSLNIINSLYATGIKGFVHKNERIEVLLEAIQYVLKTGKVYIPEEIKDFLNKIEKPIILSQREKEIVKHIVEGKSTKEIAELEFISVNTVVFHRKNLFKKFKVKNVAELVREVIEFGHNNNVY